MKTYWSPLELSMVVLIGSFVCSQEISEAPSQTPVSLAQKKGNCRCIVADIGRPILPTKDFVTLFFSQRLTWQDLYVSNIATMELCIETWALFSVVYSTHIAFRATATGNSLELKSSQKNLPFQGPTGSDFHGFRCFFC